jgi:IS30 family transposase
MAREYKQLNYEDRVEIRARLRAGESIRKISRGLSRAPSTICRELKRNEQFANTRVIYPIYAQMKANGRRRRSYRKPRLKSVELQAYVIDRLKAGWSPMVISGRLKYLGNTTTVSHEAIYQFIYACRPDLRDCLARHHRRRKRFRQSKKFSGKPLIPHRIGINERPASVASRTRIGHWEGDLMVSKAGLEAVQVLLERKSRMVLLSKIDNKKAQTVRKTIISKLKKVPAQYRKTITYDNGKENVEHHLVNEALGTRSYFADTYASWQKGSVENVIGIIRRTYPKKTNIGKIPLQELSLLERRLNSTPRKCLQFRTPMEVFNDRGVALQC